MVAEEAALAGTAHRHSLAAGLTCWIFPALLKAGSTAFPRNFLRIVLRDKLVLRAISRAERWSRSALRRITFSNSMLITPVTPAENSRGKVKTSLCVERAEIQVRDQKDRRRHECGHVSGLLTRRHGRWPSWLPRRTSKQFCGFYSR
jgi:hypothetical protein